jgi:hypothetical protein
MDNDDINEAFMFKTLLNSEIKKCREAIEEHKPYAEVKIIYLRIKELEDAITLLQQNFLS